MVFIKNILFRIIIFFLLLEQPFKKKDIPKKKKNCEYKIFLTLFLS